MKPSSFYIIALMLALLTAPLHCLAADDETWLMAEEPCFFTGITQLYDDMKEADTADDICWVKPYKVTPYAESVFVGKTYIKRIGIQRSWRLVHEDGQSVLHCYFVMPHNAVKDVWLGGDEAFIIDAKTGVRYKSRGTTDPKMWNQTFGIKAPAGSVVEFLVYFPPLPEEVNDVKIFGVQKWNLRGKRIRILHKNDTEEYDSAPSMHVPQLLEAKEGYNKDDMDTYDVYTGAHLIKPVKEMTMALWRTPETTYLAIAMELDWTREYFSFPRMTALVDQHTGKSYKVRRVQGLPLEKLFFIEGVVGDFVAFVLEFEPLPLTTTTIIYNQPESEPFNVWGANWESVIIKNLSVSDLIDNQPLFDYHERVIVK